jgi:hypothetical protein
MTKPIFPNRASGLCWAAWLILTPLLAAQAGGPHEQADALIGYELVGQVLNTGTQSLQYGYLNYVRGLPRIATTGTISETSALLTFYNDTTTEHVINNGPIRVVDRTGTSTIYFDPTGFATFTTPDTFRDGTAVQVCNLRHQVVIDTSTGYFTVTFEMVVTSSSAFMIDGHTYRIGKPGDVYGIAVSGKLASPGPPSAYIAAVAMGLGADVVDSEK